MEKGMTLKEYLNQKDPIRRPRVILKENEITKGNTINGMTPVWIEGISFEYLLENESGHIYTVDKDGNKRSLSVFRIL